MQTINRTTGKSSPGLSRGLLALCGLLALPGCNDQLLPADSDTQSEGPAKVVFTEVTQISSTEYTTAFVRTNADGSARVDLTEGAILAPPGRSGAALVRDDNSVWLSPFGGSGGAAPLLVVTGSLNPNDPEPGYIDGLTAVATPSGTRVTYTRYQDRTTFIAGPGGSNPVILPRSVAHQSTPSFSPDGSRLAFFSADSVWAGSPGGLYIVNVDGTDLRRLASCDRVAYNGQSSIDWSPSGDRLVFVEADTRIRVINVDGSGEKMIASGAHPVWNPAGDSILFTHASANADLFLTAADGSGSARPITATPALIEFYPRFSPDGRQIVYTTYVDQIDEGPGQISVHDLFTGTTTILCEKGFRGFWVK